MADLLTEIRIALDGDNLFSLLPMDDLDWPPREGRWACGVRWAGFVEVQVPGGTIAEAYEVIVLTGNAFEQKAYDDMRDAYLLLHELLTDQTSGLTSAFLPTRIDNWVKDEDRRFPSRSAGFSLLIPAGASGQADSVAEFEG